MVWYFLTTLSLAVSVVLTEVFTNPPIYISVPDGTAMFFCFTNVVGDGVENIHWLFNDTLLDNLELNNAETELTGSGTGLLELSNIFQSLNGTRIECRIEFMSGRTETSTTTSILLVQGNLSVSSLDITTSNTTIFLTWTAPTLLDVNSDITYCVDVVNSLSTLHSECGINVTEFNYPIPPDDVCHTYNFTVVPVAQVGYEEAVSISYRATGEAPEIISWTLTTSSPGSSIILIIVMSAPVCNGELNFVDINTGRRIILEENNLIITGNILALSATQLTTNRHYNVTARAINVAGSATSYTNISSHAVSGVTVIETEHNTLVITIRYFEHSSAGGALLVIVFTESDFIRSVLLTVDRETDNYTLPFNFSPGQYQVFIYDIEQDKTLKSGVGYPAVKHQLVISKNSQGISFQPVFSLIESCRISNSLRFIWAECTYPVNSIVAGFQMTAQLRNSSQVHKLFSGKVISPQTSVAIAVEENGIYQVSIIGIRRGTGIVESEVEHVEMVVVNNTLSMTGTVENTNIDQAIISIGIGFGILALIIVILCGIIIALCYRVKSGKQHKTQVRLVLSEEKNTTVVIGENQLYAEIRDPEPSCSATQNVVTPPSVPAPRGPASPYYEDVDVPKSGGDYQLTQCEAYGVH